MRSTGLGALAGAGLMLLAMLATGQRNEAAAQYGAASYGGSPPSAGELITHTFTTAENRQLLTLIDPKSKVICVYQIEPATGVVALKSVRNFQWDLQMSEFNAVSPLPREIRAMLENH
ncbi:MAG TPA: hypothetical protein VG056_05400 [Pirellulales bacterium]|jgi:hypothetical protein|nr:hypothetical protein [Pirellulales bacterium]